MHDPVGHIWHLAEYSSDGKLLAVSIMTALFDVVRWLYVSRLYRKHLRPKQVVLVQLVAALAVSQ